MKIAFAGAFAVRLEERVRAHLTPTHDVILADEAGITAKLADVDVLVTMAFTREMAGAARRLKLVRCPAPASTGSIAPRCPPAPRSRTRTATRSASRST